MLSSLILRFALVLVAFYYLAKHMGWQGLLAATVGFTLICIIVVNRVKANDNSGTRDSNEEMGT